MTEILQDKHTIKEKNNTSSYRSIFKATSLFGGVQVYQILIKLVKSKIIAVLLGPVGVGMLGLFISADQLIKSVSAMGLSSSAVRDISQANKSNDYSDISKKVAIVKRLVLLTGLLGMALTILFSPLLSIVSFGSYEYIFAFTLLSSIMLLDQLCAGQKIILQGLRQIKRLAIATAIGSTVGLAVSVPFYYWMGVNGIVPTLVLSSAMTLLFTWLIARKNQFTHTIIKTKEAIKEGAIMIKLGLAMSLSGILANLVAYVIRSFIRYYGDISEVGIFTAGFTLMTTYTGLVFTAMGTDYFPRLAEVNKDNEKCKEIINQQAEIGVLILTPLIVMCMVFVPYVISLLYSNKFHGADGYILWASCGMLFKMASWAISYVYVAKAEAKIYVVIEIVANILSLVLSIGGYILWGITGMGIAFALMYLFYFILVYLLANRKYNFTFSHAFKKLFVIESFFLLITLGLVLTAPVFYKYIIGIVFIIMSLMITIIELNRRMDLVNVMKNHGRRH